MQNAKIFSDPNLFEIFFHDFENQIINHKLWLDRKVKEHLVVMQLYFSFFNLIPLVIKRTPLPKGKELSDEEFKKVHKKLLMILGHTCNGVQREHNKKLNNGLPILHKVPPKRDYGRYFCIMAEKGGTSHGGLTEKLSPFFHAKKQEVNAYGR